MEIKINREIRNYTESIFFGLTLRQLIFSLLAILTAVGIYFGLKDVLGTEAVSWLCIICAVPFAALGYISYQDMNAVEFLIIWTKSELIEPKVLIFEERNLYADLLIKYY